MPTYEYQCEKCGIIEIFHGIKEDNKTICPECGTDGLAKCISAGVGFIMKGKMPNQYNDIKLAKYWRDHNGVKHRVTSGDGHSNSPTVSRKRTRTPEQVEAIRKADQKATKKRREAESYRRYVDQVKKSK